MNHSLAQIFGARLAATVAQRDVVCCAVVLDNNRVINGNVGGTLIEVAYGIAAYLHDFVYQLVRLRDRSFRVVNKLGLHGGPAARKIGSAWLEKAVRFEAFPCACAKLQNVFTPTDITFFLDYSIVLGAEALPEHLAAPFSHEQETDDGNRPSTTMTAMIIVNWCWFMRPS